MTRAFRYHCRHSQLNATNYVNVLAFWATVCKTVRFMLSVRCLSVLSVRLVLWRNVWTDQDETWQAGRPQPRPHCVRWGRSSPPAKGGGTPFPNFRPISVVAKWHGWIKMPLGMEVGLSPSDIVLDGDQLPSPKRGWSTPNFRPISVVAK